MIRFLIIAIFSVMSLAAYSAPQSSDPVAAPVASQGMPIEEAVKIVQSYMSELSSLGIDGKTVHDISLLPDTKPRITTALRMLMEATTVPEEKSNYKTGIMVLAFFQPGVGPAPVALDQMGPDQQTWQVVVEKSMQESAVPN